MATQKLYRIPTNYFGNLNGVYGIKTGFTNGANRCLVTACKRGDMDLVCVVLGADTKNFRTQDSVKLIEYSFKTFEYFNIKNFVTQYLTDWQNNHPNFFSIEKGISQDILLKFDSSLDELPIIPLKKELISSLETNLSMPSHLQAPLYKDDPIGELTVSSQGNLIAKFNLLSNTTINKNMVLNYMINFFKTYPYQIERSILQQ